MQNRKILNDKKFNELLSINITKFILSNHYKVGKVLNNLGINTLDKVKEEYERLLDKKSYRSARERQFLEYFVNLTIVETIEKRELKKQNAISGINKDSLLDIK